jgi:hypothetical protein
MGNEENEVPSGFKLLYQPETAIIRDIWTSFDWLKEESKYSWFRNICVLCACNENPNSILKFS